MTPAATLVAVEERNKRDMTTAWQAAILQRMDVKHFPKKPEDMWTAPAPADGERGLLAFARGVMAHKQRAKRKAARAGKRRKTGAQKKGA